MEWEEASGSVGGGRWSKECGIWAEGWMRKDEMQMKRASEDVETVRARKCSIEEGGIQS